MTFDPIADMLTRIRNAMTAKHDTVLIPASQIKKAIADLLVSEGYLKSAEVVGEGTQKNILVTIKYGENHERVINGLKRISTPGLRIYSSYEELPKVLNGLGIAIISTNKGIMTDKQAREAKVGGEVLAYIW